MKKQSKVLASIVLLNMVSSAAIAESTHTEYPDAIVCSGTSGGDEYELIYYKTQVSDTDYVRYDCGSSSNRLHFFGATGVMYTGGSSPNWVNCVSSAMSITEIIENGQALSMFSPIPTGTKFSN